MLVLITVPSLEVGRNIAEVLVNQRLAACVNIVPHIRSLYIWEGKLCDDEETLLMCKTRSSLFEEHFLPTVKLLHPYEVPEIIALPIVKGLPAYLEWVAQATT
ncbi:MAG: divalent-cation tolerance protein CutA [Anaerolineae bacterium]|nr:divalent-cation tolerance protein CutA [Anaerolineae bacterium]